MTSRPLVTIQSTDDSAKLKPVTLPSVFVSPIRSDIVVDVHTRMNKNRRQPYGVKHSAGEDTSAESWGTGRAVSRIPRVKGGGTHRSGQAAFGNMCRGGRMFAPNKVWRRWHIKISQGQRRYATCSALAATAVPALVMARGHRVQHIPEVPLVVADKDLANIAKTKAAVALLKHFHAYDDIERVKASHKIRAGQGKARNRRYVQRRGPLIIHNKDRAGNTLVPAFRNIPGVDLCHVNRLNLLQLAPGGHLGRFVIWTESAFKSLDNVFGTRHRDSTQKSGFRPPRSILTNPDITRIINSDEVQSVLRPKDTTPIFHPRKKNPLVNFGAMVKLNPYAVVQKRRAILESHAAVSNEEKRKKARKHVVKNARKQFLKTLHTPTIAPIPSEDERLPKW